MSLDFSMEVSQLFVACNINQLSDHFSMPLACIYYIYLSLFFRYLECNDLLADCQYAYRKKLDTCAALLDMTCHMQRDLIMALGLE